MKTKGFKVDFLCIGSHRCGTTWLYSVVKQHPEVCVPKNIKEVNFFNEKDKDEDPNYKYDKGIGYYRSFWPKDIRNKKIGEVSPIYMMDKKAAKRIKNHFPKVNLIVMVKDPVDKAFSHYLVDRNYGVAFPSHLSFQEAIKRHPPIIKRCMFYKQLKRYYDIFPSSQIKVILLDEVKKDAKRVAKDVYKFIGVNEGFKPNVSPRNKTLVIKYNWLNKIKNFIFNIPLLIVRNRVTEAILSPTAISRMKDSKLVKIYSNTRYRFSRIGLITEPKPKIDSETKKRMLKYFKEDIKKLEKLIDKDLSHWT